MQYVVFLPVVLAILALVSVVLQIRKQAKQLQAQAPPVAPEKDAEPIRVSATQGSGPVASTSSLADQSQSEHPRWDLEEKDIPALATLLARESRTSKGYHQMIAEKESNFAEEDNLERDENNVIKFPLAAG